MPVRGSGVAREWAGRIRVDVAMAQSTGSEDTAGAGESASSWELRSGLARSGLDESQLWIACSGIGGALGPADLEAALAGTLRLSDHDHDVVAQALNDRFVELGMDHPVPYARDIRQAGQ